MKVTFYKYGSNHSGFYVQRDVVDKVQFMTKKELMGIADLRHNVLNKKDFYDTLSTDIKGNLKEKFDLLSSLHLLVVEPFVKNE
jgi:hypothetical protein